MQSILERPFLALGKTEGRIPFGSTSGGLTDVFFLIASVEDRGHLQVLARLSRLIGSPAFLEELRTATNVDQALAAVAAHEALL
jgi:PTS system nitrogen regulatory IIA component